MSTTSPDGIYSPESAENWQYVAQLLAMAESVQEALNNVRRDAGSLRVANAAERDDLFPTPAQGDRVWRIDLGYTQTYYALYHATSNPGGMTPAQWAKDGFNTDIGALPVSQGGTGGANKVNARANLGFTSGTAAPSGGADGDWYAMIV